MAQMNTAQQYRSSKWGERIGFGLIALIVALIAGPSIFFPTNVWDFLFGCIVALGSGAAISEGLS